MKVVIPKEQMEQRNLGYLAVAVNSSSVSLPTPTHLWRAIPGVTTSPLTQGHCYHPLSGWTFGLLQLNQLGLIEREAETLSHGKHQLEMSPLQPKHSQNAECFFSMCTELWETWGELFTCTAGSPAKRSCSWNAEVSWQVCSPWALCVGVHWPLLARPRQLPTQHHPWENIPAGKAQLPVKRQQKRQNQPSGDMQEIFCGVFNNLKASVIVSYYYRNKSQYRDKGDLEASENPSQSYSPHWGKIRGKNWGLQNDACEETGQPGKY